MANKTSEKKTEVQTTAKGKAAQKVKNSSANLTRKVQKEPVKIREQVLSNGTRSLYLDIIYHGKRKREFLKAYLVDAKTPAERRQNAQAMAFAEAVKGKRLIELQTKEYSFTKQYEEDTPFLTYFRSCVKSASRRRTRRGTGVTGTVV